MSESLDDDVRLVLSERFIVFFNLLRAGTLVLQKEHKRRHRWATWCLPPKNQSQQFVPQLGRNILVALLFSYSRAECGY